ncbi:MAG: LysM peptidoglycan-binding domain-containing protein [Anaerolineales bacterium]|nr:LysM peptidoglycan-binding domain-containing protein [Anaerolineales bacterium]
MKTKSALPLLIIVGLFVLSGISAFLDRPASAAPFLQLTDFPTPTAGADGRIIYIVQPGDTLWRISAISGVSLDELRSLNNLDAEAVISEGQQLLLGFGNRTEPTQDPNAAPTAIPPGFTPTPTAGPSSGIVCILLFEDLNGDAIRQETEFGILNGAINLANTGNNLTFTGETTDATETDEFGDIVPTRTCFQDIPVGNYTISVAAPDGYNPTTFLNYTFVLQGGDEAYLDFGAQISTAGEAANPPPEEGGRSPTMGIVGSLFILSGVGLALYVFFFSGGRKVTRAEE